MQTLQLWKLNVAGVLTISCIIVESANKDLVVRVLLQAAATLIAGLLVAILLRGLCTLR